jgi:hypothetical protein
MELKSMLPVRHIALSALAAALLAASSAQVANAAFGILSVAGAVEVSVPPPPLTSPLPNVHPGSLEGPLPIIFPEILFGSVTNALGMGVDHDGTNVVAAPTISGNVVNPALKQTTLLQNTKFNSYLFHFDPSGAPLSATYVTTLNFALPVIGVQLFSNGFALQKPTGTGYTGKLEQGDAEVFANGGPGAAYYPGGVDFRGVEEDAFVLAIAGNTVILAGSAHGAEIDQVRIFTAAVPEPATVATWAILATIGCVGVVVWRRHIANEPAA